MKPQGAGTASAPTEPQQPQTMTIEQAMAVAHGHWNAGQPDQAERLCRQVLAVWPGHADALHLLGVMAHAWGNLDLAVDYLKQACQAPRAPGIFYSNLCEMLRQKGDRVEAEAAGRRAVTLDGTLSQAWNNLGIVLQELNKLDESLTCLERTVALAPTFVEAQSNLGNTLKKLGDLQRARQQYMRAIALNDNYAEAHSNLATVLNQLGERDEALAQARRAIEINPRLADAYINAAAVESSRGRSEEALRFLDGVLSFAGDNVGALSARASALRKLERIDEALQTARRAAALAPNDGDAQNTLALMLQAEGLNEEALSAFDRAGMSGGEPGAAMCNKATLLMELGRTDEAMVLFDSTLKQNPDLVSAWFNRADGKKFAAGDPDIAEMERLISSPRVQSFDDRMCLHFALGKALLDAGDPARGFAHLDEGNRLKRSTFEFDSNSTSAWMKRITDFFPAEIFERFKGAGDQSETPVFVVGMPRSGTTLIEQVLASHLKVHGAGELPHLQSMVRQVYGQDRSPQPYPEFMTLLGNDQLTQMGRIYLSKIAPLATGYSRLVDKMPANFIYAGLIHLILPNARIIHIRRDPVDTCLSCYTKLFAAEQSFAYNLAELGRFHRDYQALMGYWRTVLPASTLLEVDYENVVDDLEGQSRKMIDFIGLPWDEGCLRFYENQRPVRTASMNQVRKPVYRSSVGRWKPYSPYLGPLLSALGDSVNTGTAEAPAAAAAPAAKPAAAPKKPRAKSAKSTAEAAAS